jgi:hypothetical protein
MKRLGCSHYCYVNKINILLILLIVISLSSCARRFNQTNVANITYSEVAHREKEDKDQIAQAIKNSLSTKAAEDKKRLDREISLQSFDNLEDLEVIKTKEIKQERDLKKYPIAGMYYQYMVKKSRFARDNLIKNCNKVSRKVPSAQCKIPDIKEFERTIEKINNDYHGDFKKMLDIVRGSIVAPDLPTLRKAIVEFNKYYTIAYTKNRIKNPLESGYRDFTEIFYDAEVDFYGEIQFYLCSTFMFKKQEHKIYKVMRSIEGRAKLEQRDLTIEEEKQIDSIVQKTKEGYEQAFQDALRGKERKIKD